MVRAFVEIAAVVATGIAFLVLAPLLPSKIFFIVPCIVAWLVYVATRDRATRKRWGLRADNLREAAPLPLTFMIATMAAITVYRVIAGWKPLPASSILIFAAYPLWALFQQLFAQSLIAGNLQRLGVKTPVVVAISAALFGVVHIQDPTLTVLCTGAGVFWTYCFLRVPNILPLALAHAWSGTLTYYWVLERIPLAG